MDLVKLILQTYKIHWSELVWKKQRHFAFRARLVSNDLFWEQEWQRLIVLTRTDYRQLVRFSELEQKTYSKKAGLGVYGYKPNDEGKVSLLGEFPEIIYWEDCLVDGRYLYWWNQEIFKQEPYEPNWQIIEIRLKDGRFWEKYPVWAIERIFDLYWQKKLDRREKLKYWFDSLYQNINTVEAEWNSYYFLTHAVIGESMYYQKKVAANLWAIQELEKRWERILETKSVDLIAEVGLCLMMSGVCGLHQRDSVQKAIISQFSKTQDRLVRNRGEINGAEHRNIMAVLFLGKWGQE